MCASSSSSSSLTSCPFSQYFPLVGVSRQPIRFISVDFPEPDGPMIATYSPRLISMSMVAVDFVSRDFDVGGDLDTCDETRTFSPKNHLQLVASQCHGDLKERT